MKVLQVVGALNQASGGPLRAVLDLSARVERLGVESDVLGFGDVQIPDNPLPPSRIHALEMSFPRSYCYSPRLREWSRKRLHEYDVVVLHSMWLYPMWAVSRECRTMGKPYVYFPHGMLDLWPIRGQGLLKRVKKTIYWYLREKEIAENAASVWFTTAREMDNARQTFPIERVTRIVIPYGIDTELHDQGLPRAELVQPPDRKIALFLGRLHPVKNVDLLIDCWKAAKLPDDWHLVLAGPCDPEYRRHLYVRIEESGLGKNVHFTGKVFGADKSYLLRRANWFLLPSHHENFGIAVLEAIAAKCAVAISDQVYLSDYFPDGCEVLPLQHPAWIDFMKNRMTNDSHRKSVMTKCRNELIQRFEIDVVSNSWVVSLRAAAATATRG